MLIKLFFILILVKTKDSDMIQIFRTNIREQELNYCSRQFYAIKILKKSCELFWKRAKKNKNFRRTLFAEVGRLKLRSDKKIFNFWLDYVISFAKGEYVDYTPEFLKTKNLLEKNVQNFYAIMQAISQHLDFSNPINVPLIMSLVYDISKSIGSLSEEHPFRIPPLDLKKTARIYFKAKKFEQEMKKYNYDTFRFEEATAGQMNLLNERIESLIYDRNLIDSNQHITNEELCNSNGKNSFYFFNLRLFNGTRCNKEYKFCSPKQLYDFELIQSSGELMFYDSEINRIN